MKKTLTIAGVIAVIAVLAWGATLRTWKEKKLANEPVDYKNASYLINGIPFKLVNGRLEEPIANSNSKIITQYFGNEAVGDLNNDGLPDVAFILTQSTGGTGTFYYATVALKTAEGFTGTNAIGLGDRIAPQTTEIRDGEVIVNYADRKPEDSMLTEPSVGVSKYLIIQDGVLLELKRDMVL
jgi:hypothetical protein